MTAHIHTLLALGDSYTIGEGVPLYHSFPYQLVQILRKQGYNFHAPEIVAQTGWTTTELAGHLIHHTLEEHYDFATLLIGVNNQYRGLSLDDFAEDFDFLVKKAIHLVKGHAQCVMILSVPDWGASPFAKEKDGKDIMEQVGDFNTVSSNIAFKYDCTYCNITPGTRKVNASGFTADGLHYSEKEYGRWAMELAGKIGKLIA